MEKLILTVTADQAGRTVKSLMRQELSMADGLISSAKFRPMGICLNGVRARTNTAVQAGDVLTVRIGDRGNNAAAPIEAPLSVVWEDASFAIVDKPAGISVYGGSRPNLAGILSLKWGSNIKFHPVNRLDVGTSGLMIVAKDGYIHDRLRRLLHTDAFIREYLAVTEGVIARPSGSITLPIGRAPVSGTRRAVDPNGLPCRTDYTLLETKNGRSLLRLRLYTGRTHQIRVHMAAQGCPLTGDRLYGTASPDIDRPALHSLHIRLVHPLTGEVIDVTAPVPADMAALL